MLKKIIWALLEVATIGYGSFIFVSTMVNEDYIDHVVAGTGAFLIVLGILLRNWRMTLFIKEEKKEGAKDPKSENQTKSLNLLLILILSFTFFLLNRKISSASWDIANNESQIQSLDSRLNELDDMEYRLDNIELLEERLEDLENYSHYHY